MYDMATRMKRSISLPSDVSASLDAAAAAEGSTVSAWITATIAHRLRLEAGRRGIAEWEQENGQLTTEELAQGLAQARALLAQQHSLQRHAS
jgi:predicted transcriptional regulator